jgi:hypothetical protein
MAERPIAPALRAGGRKASAPRRNNAIRAFYLYLSLPAGIKGVVR